MRKLATLVVLALLIPLASSALTSSAAQGDGVIVASTTWTAALARAAGAQGVIVLAPAALQNPAIYTLTAKDAEQLKAAKWVLYSGDERFAEQLAQAAGNAPGKLLKVRADNSPEVILSETAKLAAIFGTQAAQSAWAASFQGVSSRAKAEINALFGEGTRVIAHRSQAGLARWLGFKVVVEALPGELDPQQLDRLAAEVAEIVLDSYHDPLGPLVGEKSQALYVQLLSYPGKDKTATLEDVLRYNRAQIAPYVPAIGAPTEAAVATARALPFMIAGAVVGLLILVSLAILFIRLKRRSAAKK
jgi:zinc transport system substrate-binding protein